MLRNIQARYLLNVDCVAHEVVSPKLGLAGVPHGFWRLLQHQKFNRKAVAEVVSMFLGRWKWRLFGAFETTPIWYCCERTEWSRPELRSCPSILLLLCDGGR